MNARPLFKWLFAAACVVAVVSPLVVSAGSVFPVGGGMSQGLGNTLYCALVGGTGTPGCAIAGTATTGSEAQIGVAAATTQGAGALTGLTVDMSTNLTGANAQDLKGINISTLGGTRTGSGTENITGVDISSGAGLTQTTAAGTQNWRGTKVAIPATTQTTGTIFAIGHDITTGAVAASGNVVGIQYTPTANATGSTYGYIAQGIGANAGTSFGFYTGTGYDTGIYNGSSLDQLGTIANSGSGSCLGGLTTGDVCINDTLSINGNITTQVGVNFVHNQGIIVNNGDISNGCTGAAGAICVGDSFVMYGSGATAQFRNATAGSTTVVSAHGVDSNGAAAIYAYDQSTARAFMVTGGSGYSDADLALRATFGGISVPVGIVRTDAVNDNVTIVDVRDNTSATGVQHFVVKGGGLVSLGTTVQTVASVDAGALDPTSSSISVTGDGCVGKCYYTMGETNATAGDIITVCASSNTVGTAHFPDVANVFAGPNFVATTGLGADDCFTAKYDSTNSMWKVTATSDN